MRGKHKGEAMTIKQVLIVLNGRSIQGILSDARREFGEMSSLVVCRNGDTLPVPDGLPSVAVNDFAPDQGTQYILVANGGTSAQLAPVLLRLERSGVIYRIVDLQKNGMVELGGRRPILFLCPINDGEAVEIINLLIDQQMSFITTYQDWGASWEHLEPIVVGTIKTLLKESPNVQIIGIELQGQARFGGINIDHHRYDGDDRSNPLSSLEQVAKLVGVELDRHQQLVAVNDRGYIPAMIKELDAGVQEILDVRSQDRKAQGITQEQEEEAYQAIDKVDGWGKACRGELVIIEMTHSKCSCVKDHLFLFWKDGRERLLVLSADGEANFYGDGAVCAQLQESFGGWT